MLNSNRSSSVALALDFVQQGVKDLQLIENGHELVVS